MPLSIQRESLRTAFVMLLDSLLEFLEYRIEVRENTTVAGAFLEYMVKQTYSHHEFFGVFFGDIALGGYLFDHSGKVVMTAEVEVHHFLDLTVHNFGDIEVLGTSFFVAVTIAVHNTCFFVSHSK